MFSLVDGRDCFYQWDINRQLKVSDPTVTEVHFCNRTDDCSLVVEVKDGLANVPNILLQDDYPIRVYAFCTDYTKVEKIFKVCKRTKPADYVYEETEVIIATEVLNRATIAIDTAEELISTVEDNVDSIDALAKATAENATKAEKAEENASNSATEALSNANKTKMYESNAQQAALDATAAKEQTEALKEDVAKTVSGIDEKMAIVNTKADQAITATDEVLEFVENNCLEFNHDGAGNVTLEGVSIADVAFNAEDYYDKTATDQLLEDYALKTDLPGTFTFRCTDINNVTEEEINVAREVCKYIIDNNEAPKDKLFYINCSSGEKMLVSTISASSTSAIGAYHIWFRSSLNITTDIEYAIRFVFNDDDSLNTVIFNQRSPHSNYVTKTYVDDAISNVDVDLTGYATEEYVDDAVSNIPSSSGAEYEMSTIVESINNTTTNKTYTYDSSNVLFWVVSVQNSYYKGDAIVPAGFIPTSSWSNVLIGSGVSSTSSAIVKVTNSSDSTIALTICTDNTRFSVFAFRKKD